MTLPPIDAHAHVATDVSAQDIVGLNAFVAAVTREPHEWQPALRRRDDMAVWGIGVHPGIPAAVEAFESKAFAQAVAGSFLVGEVGLDGRSKVAAIAQRRVFDSVLAVVGDCPRPTSIHSVSASRHVIDALAQRPIAAPVLHWWRGNRTETDEAIALGCFFSLNGAEAKNPKVLEFLPPDRVLTETDFPHSTRVDRAAREPAAVGTIEHALMDAWELDELALRRRLWRNLAALYDRCDLVENLPEAVQEIMLTAGLD